MVGAMGDGGNSPPPGSLYEVVRTRCRHCNCGAYNRFAIRVKGQPDQAIGGPTRAERSPQPITPTVIREGPRGVLRPILRRRAHKGHGPSVEQWRPDAVRAPPTLDAHHRPVADHGGGVMPERVRDHRLGRGLPHLAGGHPASEYGHERRAIYRRAPSQIDEVTSDGSAVTLGVGLGVVEDRSQKPSIKYREIGGELGIRNDGTPVSRTFSVFRFKHAQSRKQPFLGHFKGLRQRVLPNENTTYGCKRPDSSLALGCEILLP
jgi:hypothetical protein